MFKTLTPMNFDRETGSQIPVLTRFFTAHRQNSLQMDEQWDLIGQMYRDIPGITVAHVNCGKYRYFCYDQGVYQTPEIRLYFQNETHFYEGGGSHESVTRWAAAKTKVDARQLLQAVRRPNGRVFKELLNDTQCVFGVFYNGMNSQMKQLLAAIEKVAEAFKYDKTVEFCLMDVDLYKFYNWDYDLGAMPDARLWTKQEADFIKYDGKKAAVDLLDFINDRCETSRDINGRLTQEAGLIEEAARVIEDFFRHGKSDKYVKALEALDGGAYYAWVAKEVQSKGEGFVKTERNRLLKLLDGGVSPDRSDEFQIRVNILGVFAGYIEE